MTNKEELRNKAIEYIDTKYSNIERWQYEGYVNKLSGFFWNEIQQIRKSDMERVDTIELIIKDIKSYSPDGEIGTLCNQALSIIKQPKGSFAVWTPEIKEHANQVKEIIENREKHETVS